MAWIKATYQPEGKVPLPLFINLDLVRCVRRTDEGKARVVWGASPQAHTQILCESYSLICKRIEAAIAATPPSTKPSARAEAEPRKAF